VRNLITLLAGMSLVLGVSAGAIYGLHDRQLLVSPPEMAVEGFTKSLVERRFGPALSYLTEGLQETSGKSILEKRTSEFIEQHGEVEGVAGEIGTCGRDRATAVAIVKTGRAGPKRLAYQLVFQDGSWKISVLPSELR
jgi:hypothetical protein